MEPDILLLFGIQGGSSTDEADSSGYQIKKDLKQIVETIENEVTQKVKFGADEASLNNISKQFEKINAALTVKVDASGIQRALTNAVVRLQKDGVLDIKANLDNKSAKKIDKELKESGIQDVEPIAVGVEINKKDVDNIRKELQNLGLEFQKPQDIFQKYYQNIQNKSESSLKNELQSLGITFQNSQQQDVFWEYYKKVNNGRDITNTSSSALVKYERPETPYNIQDFKVTDITEVTNDLGKNLDKISSEFNEAYPLAKRITTSLKELYGDTSLFYKYPSAYERNSKTDYFTEDDIFSDKNPNFQGKFTTADFREASYIYEEIISEAEKSEQAILDSSAEIKKIAEHAESRINAVKEDIDELEEQIHEVEDLISSSYSYKYNGDIQIPVGRTDVVRNNTSGDYITRKYKYDAESEDYLLTGETKSNKKYLDALNRIYTELEKIEERKEKILFSSIEEPFTDDLIKDLDTIKEKLSATAYVINNISEDPDGIINLGVDGITDVQSAIKYSEKLIHSARTSEETYKRYNNEIKRHKNALTQANKIYSEAANYHKEHASGINKNIALAVKWNNLINKLKNNEFGLDTVGAREALAELQTETKLAGAETSTLASDIRKLFKDHFGSISATTAIGFLADTLRRAYDDVVLIDDAMTELKKVTDLAASSYENFQKAAANTAEKVGGSIADTIDATADFARLGYNVEDAAELAEAAMIYKNVGDGIEDISTASESLISTMKGFGLEASDAMSIIDKFNEVGNNYAIDSVGIGEALRRSAAALSAAGNTLDESIALVTAANNVVQDPDSVGTAMKTISMFLRAAKTEAEEAGIETEGMASSVSKLRQELLQVTGIDIMLDDSTFKSTYQILQEISKIWDDLADVDRANIAERLAGKRQSNILFSILENFDEAKAVLSTASDSDGSARKENEKYLDSITGKIQGLLRAYEELSSGILDSELLKSGIEFLTGILDFFNELEEPLTFLLSAIGAIASTNIGQKYNLSLFNTVVDGNGLKQLTLFNQEINRFDEILDDVSKFDLSPLEHFKDIFGLSYDANIQRINDTEEALNNLSESLFKNEDKNLDIYKEIPKRFKNCSSEAREFAYELVQTSKSTGDAKDKTEAFITQQKKQAEAMKLSSRAASVAKTALASLANIAVSFAINWLISEIGKAIQSTEELREAAIDSAMKNKELAASMSELIPQYEAILDSDKSVIEKTKELDEWKQTLIDTYSIEKERLEEINLEREKGVELLERELNLNSVNKASLWLATHGNEYEEAKEVIEGANKRGTPTSGYNQVGVEIKAGSTTETYEWGNIDERLLEFLSLPIFTGSNYKGFGGVGEKYHVGYFDIKGDNLIENYNNIENALTVLGKIKEKTIEEEALLTALNIRYEKIKEELDKHQVIYETGKSGESQVLYENYQSVNNIDLNKIGKETYLSWRNGLLLQANGDGQLEKELLILAEKQFPDYTEYFNNLEKAKNKYLPTSIDTAEEGAIATFLNDLSKEDLALILSKDFSTKFPDLFSKGVDGATQKLAEWKADPKNQIDLADIITHSEEYEKVSGKIKLIELAMSDMENAGYITASTYAELNTAGGNFINCLSIQDGKIVANIQSLKDLESQVYKSKKAELELAKADYIAKKSLSINSRYDWEEWEEYRKKLEEQEAEIAFWEDIVNQIQSAGAQQESDTNGDDWFTQQKTKYEEDLAVQKDYYDRGLISYEEYLAKRKELLNEYLPAEKTEESDKFRKSELNDVDWDSLYSERMSKWEKEHDYDENDLDLVSERNKAAAQLAKKMFFDDNSEHYSPTLYKSHIEEIANSELDVLEKMLDRGIITYDEFMSGVIDIRDQYTDENGNLLIPISFVTNAQNAEKEFESKINQWKKEHNYDENDVNSRNEFNSFYRETVNGIYGDEESPHYNPAKAEELLSEADEYYSDTLNQKREQSLNYLNEIREQIEQRYAEEEEALDKINEKEQLRLDIIKARLDLENAKKNRNQLVFANGTFYYDYDQEAVKTSQETYDAAVKAKADADREEAKNNELSMVEMLIDAIESTEDKSISALHADTVADALSDYIGGGKISDENLNNLGTHLGSDNDILNQIRNGTLGITAETISQIVSEMSQTSGISAPTISEAQDKTDTATETYNNSTIDNSISIGKITNNISVPAGTTEQQVQAMIEGFATEVIGSLKSLKTKII